MDEQELNKKLAEWAGWKLINPQANCACHLNYSHWHDPTDLGNRWPNFTESLEACFKWLVPKLGCIQVDTRTDLMGRPNGFAWSIKPDSPDTLMGNWYNGEDEQVSLGICLAIEKLINTEH